MAASRTPRQGGNAELHIIYDPVRRACRVWVARCTAPTMGNRREWAKGHGSHRLLLTRNCAGTFQKGRRGIWLKKLFDGKKGGRWYLNNNMGCLLVSFGDKSTRDQTYGKQATGRRRINKIYPIRARLLWAVFLHLHPADLSTPCPSSRSSSRVKSKRPKKQRKTKQNKTKPVRQETYGRMGLLFLFVKQKRSSQRRAESQDQCKTSFRASVQHLCICASMHLCILTDAAPAESPVATPPPPCRVPLHVSPVV